MKPKISDFRIIETSYCDNTRVFTIERKNRLLKLFGIDYWYSPDPLGFAMYLTYGDALMKVRSVCKHRVRIHNLE
jgi:hypothetical protein